MPNGTAAEKVKRALMKEYERIAAETDPDAQRDSRQRVSEAEATLRNAEGG